MNARVLTPVVGGLCALCLTAGPASAKSALSIDVTPLVGGAASKSAVVSATGGDDAAGMQRLCIEAVQRGAWAAIDCGPIRLGTGGRVRIVVLRSAVLPESYRAQLEHYARKPGAVPVVDLTSAPATLAPPHPQHAAASTKHDTGIEATLISLALLGLALLS